MSAPTQADVAWAQVRMLAEAGRHTAISISTTLEAVEAFARLTGARLEECEDIRVREGRLCRQVFAIRYSTPTTPSVTLIAHRDLGPAPVTAVEGRS